LKKVFLLALTLFTISAFSQKRSDDDCIFTNRYSTKQLLQRYPFNQSDSIVLVSFHYQHKEQPPVSIDSVNKDSIIEPTMLTTREKNRLSAILFNYEERKRTGIAAMNQCFYPRHAIVFYNQGKVKDYLLICFHCYRFAPGTEKFRFPACSEKSEMLRKFFISNGVIFGTDLRIQINNGERNPESNGG